MSDTKKKQKVLDMDELDRLPLEGFTEAPMLFFDEVLGVAAGSNSGSFLLSAFVQETDSEGTVTTRKKAVAHIVGSHKAVENLRSALVQFEHLVVPPAKLTN